MNSQHKNKNSKGDFVLKPFLNVRFIDFWYAKINLTQIWYDEFNQLALKVKNSLLKKHEF